MEKVRLQTTLPKNYLALLKFLSEESGMKQAEILEQAIGNWCITYMNLNCKSELNTVRGGYNYPCLASALDTAFEKTY